MLVDVGLLVAGIVAGWIGHMTWPKWTGWLERRAEANKVKVAQKLLDKVKSEAAAVEQAKKVLAEANAMPAPPLNPVPVKPPTSLLSS